MSKKGSRRERDTKKESSHRIFEMQTNVLPLCLDEKVSGCFSKPPRLQLSLKKRKRP